MITIPNLLTLGRACAVPAFILMFHQPGWAVGLFVGAMITDAFDGLLARKANMESAIGAVLDPVADKLLLVSAFVMLFRRGDFPGWWVGLVVGRDLFILVGWTLVYLTTQKVMTPTWLGKMANVTQTVVILCHLVPVGSPGFQVVVGAVMIAVTAASGAEYLWRGGGELWRWQSVRSKTAG